MSGPKWDETTEVAPAWDETEELSGTIQNVPMISDVTTSEADNAAMAHPIAQEAEPDKMSQLHSTWNPTARSALVGMGSGATGNFAEELTAPVMAAALATKGALTGEGSPTLPDEHGLIGTWNKFKRMQQEYRDVAREEQQAAQEEHPWAYGGGAVAGGLATMRALPALPKASGTLGKIGMGAAEGAGLGAVSGAGEAEGGLKERAAGAVTGAAIGGLVGGAIPGTIAAAKVLGATGKRAAEIVGFKPSMEAYKQGTKGHDILKDEAKDIEFGNLYEKSGSLVEDLKESFTNVGNKINSALENAKGKTVDLKDELTETFDQLNKLRVTKDGAKYADDIEGQLNAILGKKKISDEFAGVDLPEGLILPKAVDDTIDLTQLTPKQAQDIKQIMFKYSPGGNSKNMTAQISDPAQVAGDLSVTARKKLADISPELAQANKEYAALSHAYDRLKINDDLLPEQQQRNVANLLKDLEKGNFGGYEAQQVIKDVVADIAKVNPQLAAKYGTELNEISKRLELIGKLQGGTNFGKAGFLQRATIGVGNLAGRAVNKINPVVKPVKTFAQNVLESPNTGKVAVTGTISDSLPTIKAATEPYKAQRLVAEASEQDEADKNAIAAKIESNKEPHKFQRQVAQAAEKAEPEMLNQEAQNIRSKYGKGGEQLATILENMATKDKNARRALMYTLLQNPSHRRMMGLMGDGE